ncbi:helix-turn-helix domain-containing protein [Actinoallomurus sp. NBC_01490]|uniref:helix-turn-helix transcriptional regulator n=1 Tax=Actinoallomurus sp. NBC_01490 TaxID=2903557 RepID=UPI002E360B7A|nr:helix-turn-helix transcriptional regulator [Actinoallomurus sp. NBC_01490]
MTTSVNPRSRSKLIEARNRAGLTQEQVAEKIGVSVTTWIRWERGKTDVRRHNRDRIADLFGVPRSEVDQWVDEAAESVPWESGKATFVSMTDTVETASELWRWDVDPTRRRLLGAIPFLPVSLNEWLLSWTLDPSAETRAHSGSGPSVGTEDVRRIHVDMQAFDQMDRQHGGGRIRPAVVSYLNHEVAPLLHGTYSDEIGAQLMSAAALMTALAGWEAYDVGAHGLAQTHYGQALKLAKAADDPLTAARVLSILAQQAIDLRHPKLAMRLASAAHQAGMRAEACPRVMAMLLLREATATALSVALADTRDAHAAERVRRLIGAAERTFASISPADQEPSWIAYFTPAELTACAGCCWEMVGEHRRALDCAEQAVRDLGASFPRAIQFNTVHAATAQLGLNELDQALASAKKAVPMANTLTSRRTIELVKAFDNKLDSHADEPRVRDWRDYLRTELRVAS